MAVNPTCWCAEHDCDEYYCRPWHDPEWVAEEAELRKDLGELADNPRARMLWAVRRDIAKEVASGDSVLTPLERLGVALKAFIGRPIEAHTAAQIQGVVQTYLAQCGGNANG